MMKMYPTLYPVKIGISLMIGALLSLPVWAQEIVQTGTTEASKPPIPPPPPPPPPWTHYLSSPMTYLYAVLAGAGCYAVSVVLMMLLNQKGYPPNTARLSSWLALTLWLGFLAFVLFGKIHPSHLPIWLLAVFVTLSAVMGLILYATRKQPSN